MKLLTLTLALITLLCTCGSAQTTPDKLPHDETNVAFIKGKTGFLIDSLTIRTSLDTFPYGFAFTSDTLFLDISIFRPVDELTLEIFASGHSFGRQLCWIDAPSADIHLSVAAGRGVIDSVGLSPMNRWFRDEINKIRSAPNLDVAKGILADAIYNSTELLIATYFIEVYANLPNLNRQDIVFLAEMLKYEIRAVKKHPRFAPLQAKRKLMASNLPGKMSKYDLMDVAESEVKVATPEANYWVLNVYSSTSPASRTDHALIRQTMETDSLFNNIPVISISAEEDAIEWAEYLQAGAFPWPHYREAPTEKAGLAMKAGLYPGSTYLLINAQNRIEGVYDNVVKLAGAILYRKRSNKP